MHFQWGNTAPQRGARDSWGGGQQKNLALLTYKAKIYIQHINSYTISVVLRKKKYTKALEEGENNEEKVERCCFKPNRLSALLTLLKFYSSSTAFKDHTKEQNLEDK